jgi:hypothetical protein
MDQAQAGVKKFLGLITSYGDLIGESGCNFKGQISPISALSCNLVFIRGTEVTVNTFTQPRIDPTQLMKDRTIHVE